MKPQHLAFILLIDLIWAVNTVAVKFAVTAVPPMTMVFIRYLIVFAVCAPQLRWVPGRMGVMVLAGLFAGALAMGLGGLSFHLADNVSALAIAAQLGVPFSLILAIIFLGERIRWLRAGGIALSFVGVAVMSFDPSIMHERVGVLLSVAASFCWAVSSLLFRKLKGISPITIHAWLALVSLPPLAMASLLFEPGQMARLGDLPVSAIGWIAFSAIFASVVGHAGMSWLFQKYPVTTVTPLTLPTPLLSVVVAVVVLDTPLTPQMIAGAVIAMAGVAIITLRSARMQAGGA